jgi:Gpi18-like mannosyltransferase
VKLPRWFTIPLLAFLITRLFIFGVGLVGDTMLTTEPGHWIADPDSPFLSMWTKWDSQYYVDIATNGYWFRPEQQSNVAFFPVYPLLMRLVGSLVQGNVILAGFIISNLAFFIALIFLYKLTALELDEGSAGRTVFYLAFFPTSFFFSSVYTESTFLMFSVAAVYFSRRHQWVSAALIGMLAAATRNLGVLVWALVLWEWLRAQGWSLKTIHKKQSWTDLLNGARLHWFEVIIICIIPLGLIIYMVFLQLNFERPMAFIETQAAWGRQNIGPLAVIIKSFNMLAAGTVNKGWLTNFWNLASLLVFLSIVPFIWSKIGEGYAIYVLIMLLVPSSSATGSMIRYVLTSFPAFMILGWWGRKEVVDRFLMGSMAVFLGLFVTIFVNWVFVG